jgi:hypothetical protein
MDRYKLKLYQSLCASVNRRSDSRVSYTMKKAGTVGRLATERIQLQGRYFLGAYCEQAPHRLPVSERSAPSLLSWTKLDIQNVAKQ